MAKRKLPVVTFADPEEAMTALKTMLEWCPIEPPSEAYFGVDRYVIPVVYPKRKRKTLTKKRKKR